MSESTTPVTPNAATPCACSAAPKAQPAAPAAQPQAAAAAPAAPKAKRNRKAKQQQPAA